MTDDYLVGLKKSDDLPDELFISLLDIEDDIDRATQIEKAKRTLKEMGRQREFDKLFALWCKKYNQMNKRDCHYSTFTDAPLTVVTGDWEASDLGVAMMEYFNNGNCCKHIACSHPILPVERLVNIDDDTEKLTVSFKKDGRWRSITADCNQLYNKSAICSLADRGVMVTSESSKDLVKYLFDVVNLNNMIIPISRSIGRLGWIGNEFAPYVEDIKYDGDIDFKSIYECVKGEGSFEAWKEEIFELRNNTIVKIILAASLASPLIEKIGALPFVLHLWGTTGFGKTVSLMLAASVWGNPEMGCLTRSMNATANSIVRTSAFLHNIPFCADELQQIKNNWGGYDGLIMFLCEGIDKGRAKAHGGIERLATWKNSFIFTGEEPVTKSSSGGGVKNRVIEIECKDKLYEDGNKVSNLIRENYGYAGIKFIEHIKKKPIDLIKQNYREIFQALIKSVPDTTEKQAMSMALVLLADKYACDSIFEGEAELTIDDVKDYLSSMNEVDMTERAYEWTVNWISENAIRFETDTDINRGSIWGRIDDDVVTVNKNVLHDALNRAGFDLGACTRKWLKNGYLMRNSQGQATHCTKVSGVKAGYLKIVTSSFEEKPADELPFE